MNALLEKAGSGAGAKTPAVATCAPNEWKGQPGTHVR